MQRRLVGSVVVVAAGLLPAMIGGPVFAVLMLVLGIVALREFVSLGPGFSLPGVAWAWYGALVLLAAGALLQQSILLLLALLVGCLLSLAAVLPHTGDPGASAAWGWGAAGVSYIGIPITAAIILRQGGGAIGSSAWQQGTEHLALGWQPAPVGLAWVLAVVLATWAGDSAAYLTGRALGRHKLAPVVSPGKTIEGSIGGLTASVLVAAAVFGVSGVLSAPLGALVGVVIGISGQCGDLCESFLKRQAGVKDSGNLIPGHGGMLDRVDALLFAFPATLLVAWIIEGSARW